MRALRHRPRRFLTITAATAAALVLAGCAPQENGTTASTAPVDTGAVSTPTVEPTFVAGGGAEENHAFFDATLKPLVAADSTVSGETMADALIEAGFDKTAIEFTADRTTIDLDAAFVMIAVKMPDDRCIVGQRNEKGYVSEVMDPISSGQCIVGAPLKVDW